MIFFLILILLAFHDYFRSGAFAGLWALRRYLSRRFARAKGGIFGFGFEKDWRLGNVWRSKLARAQTRDEKS